VTLGIASFGGLASLTAYRPYFVGVAALALLWSYVTTYRARWRELRQIGLQGYRPQAHEVVLWLITALVGLLIAFPYYNPFL